MQRKFLSNLMLIVLLNLLVKPLAIFGIDAEVQNVVGTQEYGLYFSLLNFTYIFNILLDLGITNYNTKYVAQHPHLVKRYMGKIIPLRLLLFLIYVVVSIGIALLMGYNLKQLAFLGVLIVNQFLISVILFLRSYFAGLMLFKIDILLSVLDKFILILLAGYLLYFSADKASFTMNWFVGAQLISYALSACIAIGLILSKIGIPKPTWSPAFSKVMLRNSLPYALLILLMMLYNRVDAVMIERLHPAGQAQAGIYAQSFRILDALLMFAMLFSNLLFPIFARLIRDKQSIVPLLNSASRMLLSFSIIAACCAFFYAETILSWIYRGALNQSLPVFSWLMLSFVPICITLIYGTLLTANGSLRILNKLSFVGLLANVFLNVIFIQYWGAWGAALATLLTQTAVAVLQLVFVSKYFQLQFNLLHLARYLGFVGWLISTVLLNEHFSDGNATLTVFFGSSVVALFVFRMLDWKTLLGLLRKNHS